LLLSASGWCSAYRGLQSGADAWTSGKFPLGCVLAVTLPAGLCGLVALFGARRRALCFACVAGATFLTVTLIVGCALGALAERETVGHLLLKADGEGYGGLPVVQLYTTER